MGVLTCITGVSGSGKSTLVFDVVAKSTSHKAYGCEKVIGLDQFTNILKVEQATILQLKPSNIATYSTVYTEIRAIFGTRMEARKLGLSPKHVSFNVAGGRCEKCEGLGRVVSNMLFFEDIEVPCPTCGGKQFHDDVLSVFYHQYSIKDILGMSIIDTIEVFQEYQKITRILQLLMDVGFGYIELG